MKKILLVFGSLERAGAQLRTLAICREIRQHYPVQFDFCTLGLGPNQLKTEINNIYGNVYSVPIRSARFPISFWKLLNNQQYSVVHSMPLLLSGVILWLGKLQRIPIRIAHFRSSLSDSETRTSSPLFVWLMRTLIKNNATQILAVSNTAMDTVFPPAWRLSTDCRVIYNGLAISDFQIRINKADVCKEFGWPSNSRIVIHVGRFSPPKNHQTILETIRLVNDKLDDVRFLLVGDGTLKNEIASLIDRYELHNVCVITGIRMDIPQLLLASNVFFFPSLWEGLPGALLEALATGLPIVTSDIPAILEISEYFPSSMYTASATDAEKHAEHILNALDVTVDRFSAQTHFSETPFVLENAVKAYVSLYGLTEVSSE